MLSRYRIGESLTFFPERMLNCNMYLLDVSDGKVYFDPSLSPDDIGFSGAPAAVFATHAHFDHIGAVNAWKERFAECPFLMHEKDVPMLDDTHANASSAFGFPGTFSHPDRLLRDGEHIVLDERFSLEVVHTPGHTMGSSCFVLFRKYDAGQTAPFAVISGDTLFDEGWGRTDFVTGDDNLMRLSLERLYRLLSRMPADTPVCPGHGRVTTAGASCDFLERMGFFA